MALRLILPHVLRKFCYSRCCLFTFTVTRQCVPGHELCWSTGGRTNNVRQRRSRRRGDETVQSHNSSRKLPNSNLMTSWVWWATRWRGFLGLVECHGPSLVPL